MMTRVFLLLMTSLALTAAMAQRPQRFHKQLPPGNYSGIAPLGGGRYALVSDSQNRYKGILRDWLLVLPTS